MLIRLARWFFCRIGDPIYSPSRVVLTGIYTCVHCGKSHGTLATLNAEIFKMANRDRKPVEQWTEREHQQELVKWFRSTFPQYGLMLIAPLNDAVLAGSQSAKARQANVMQTMGVVKGVADLILLIQNDDYSSLAIELKLPERKEKKDGGLSPDQIEFGKQHTECGGLYVVAYGHEDAIGIILSYISSRKIK